MCRRLIVVRDWQFDRSQKLKTAGNLQHKNMIPMGIVCKCSVYQQFNLAILTTIFFPVYCPVRGAGQGIFGREPTPYVSEPPLP